MSHFSFQELYTKLLMEISNKINSDDSLYTFMRDKIGGELLEQPFNGTQALPQVRVLSYIIGPIRIMQMRTKSTS